MTRLTATFGGLALAAVLILIVAPVAALWGQIGAGPWFEPGDLAAVRFTLIQSLLSAVISVALAVPFARALMRRRFAGRRFVIALLGAPFLLPVIVAILGLLAVWGRSGLFSQISQDLGGPRLSIYGLGGVVLAHVFFNLPLVTRLLVQGWQAIPPERFRLAAQLGMGPRAVFQLLEWPMLRAVLPGAFLLVFLLCLTSFAVALALGGGPRATTVEVAIYQALRFEFDLGHAARLALVQLGLGGTVVLLALGIARPTAFGRGLGRPPQRWDQPKRTWPDAVVVLLGIGFLVLPLGFVIIKGTKGLWAGPEVGLWRAAGVSVALAGTSALVSVLVSLAIAGLVAGLARGRGMLVEAAGLVMLATSPFVIGTGIYVILRPYVDPFAWALVVTAVINAAMSLPFGLRILVPALAAARANYRRLADSLGMTGWGRFRHATLPQIRGPLGFATGLAAALSMGDLGVITLFAPSDVATLPLYMYRLMGAYRMDQAAGAALVLLGLSLALFWVFGVLGGRHADRV